jgi:hypothetical protein
MSDYERTLRFEGRSGTYGVVVRIIRAYGFLRLFFIFRMLLISIGLHVKGSCSTLMMGNSQLYTSVNWVVYTCQVLRVQFLLGPRLINLLLR